MEKTLTIQKKVILENKRALLVPLDLTHATALAAHALDERLWTYNLNKITNLTSLEQYIQKALDEEEKGKAIPFLIIDKQINMPVGCTRFGEINPQHKSAQIGWTWIGTSFQGTGINKAVKFSMLDYGFTALKLNRIAFFIDELNMRSRKAVTEIGAKQEGVLRQHMITSSGRVRNTVVYAILKEEWAGLKTSIFKEFI